MICYVISRTQLTASQIIKFAIFDFPSRMARISLSQIMNCIGSSSLFVNKMIEEHIRTARIENYVGKRILFVLENDGIFSSSHKSHACITEPSSDIIFSHKLLLLMSSGFSFSSSLSHAMTT